jgi:hypothetical protein
MTTRTLRRRTVEEAQTRQLPNRHESMAHPGRTTDGKDRVRRKPLRFFMSWVRNDDLLSGFEREESRAPGIRSFFVSTIGAALVACDVAETPRVS